MAGMYAYTGTTPDSAYLTFWTRPTEDPEDPANPGFPVVNYPPSPGDIVRRSIASGGVGFCGSQPPA